MKIKLLVYCSCLLLASTIARADTLYSGTPANAYSLPTTSVSPNLGGVLINFDSLTAFTSLNPAAFASQGVASISSPDGLIVYPYSSQSAPNELFDNSTDGSANISIDLSRGAFAIGIGIADSDITNAGAPVTIYLQALNSSDVGFGSMFSVTLPETGSNPGNGYFIIEDTSNDLYGLQILQPVGNAASYSGLAIDDLQYAAPEPSSFLLLATGLAILGSFILIKRSKTSASC
jgi:hypothetical protein